MHVYSVPLRSPIAFPYVPWNFKVGNASDQKLEVGELRSPASYYSLTTAGCNTFINDFDLHVRTRSHRNDDVTRLTVVVFTTSTAA